MRNTLAETTCNAYLVWADSVSLMPASSSLSVSQGYGPASMSALSSLPPRLRPQLFEVGIEYCYSVGRAYEFLFKESCVVSLVRLAKLSNFVCSHRLLKNVPAPAAQKRPRATFPEASQRYLRYVVSGVPQRGNALHACVPAPESVPSAAFPETRGGCITRFLHLSQSVNQRWLVF